MTPRFNNKVLTVTPQSAGPRSPTPEAILAPRASVVTVVDSTSDRSRANHSNGPAGRRGKRGVRGRKRVMNDDDDNDADDGDESDDEQSSPPLIGANATEMHSARNFDDSKYSSSVPYNEIDSRFQTRLSNCCVVNCCEHLFILFFVCLFVAAKKSATAPSSPLSVIEAPPGVVDQAGYESDSSGEGRTDPNKSGFFFLYLICLFELKYDN